MIRKEMSIEEFMNESLEMQIAQYNILAKRTNRQIRTFKKQGNEDVIQTYFPEIGTHGNIKMIKKTTTAMLEKMKPEKAQEEMTRAYKRLLHDTHGGITRENVMRIDKEMEKVQEALNVEEMSPEQFYAYEEAEEYAKSSSALYYEVLKYGVERGYYKSYAKEDQPDIENVKEHPELLEEALTQINDYYSSRFNNVVQPDEHMETLTDIGRSAKAYYIENKMPDYTNNPPKEMRPRRTNVYVRR